MNAKTIIGDVIIFIFLVWGSYKFMNATVRYVAIDKAQFSEQLVQVMGKIDFDKVEYDSDNTRLHFAIYDVDAQNEETAPRLPVVYDGVPPGNFDQATSVVLKGKSDGSGTFVAEQMLVKCPSKYQGEGGEEYQDMKKHDEAVGASVGL